MLNLRHLHWTDARLRSARARFRIDSGQRFRLQRAESDQVGDLFRQPVFLLPTANPLRLIVRGRMAAERRGDWGVIAGDSPKGFETVRGHQKGRRAMLRLFATSRDSEIYYQLDATASHKIWSV